MEHRFNMIPVETLKYSLQNWKETILQFICKHKILRISKAILSNISSAGGIKIYNFKLYKELYSNTNDIIPALKQASRQK